jgi:general secretion pathway protein G
MNRINRSSAAQRGFTLIELLVVIMILAILAALIVPRVLSRAGDAQIAAAKSDISSLESAIKLFRLDCSRYPTTEEGLEALRTAPSGTENTWHGPYLDHAVPADPWKNAYIYKYPGNGGSDSYVVESFGADGVEGGDGPNADIVGGSD